MAITYDNNEFIGFNEYIKLSKQKGFRNTDGMPLYSHPIDGWIVSALNSMSVKNMMESVIDNLVSYSYEKTLAEGVFLDNESFPELFNILSYCSKTLQIATPHAIVSHDPALFNAYTAGTDNYAFIVIASALCKYYSNEEASFVIGHECGHIAASHMPYHTIVSSLASGLVGLLGPFGGVIQAGLSVPLSAWSRRSEITADRAGLLCCGDIKIAEKALLKLVTGLADPESVNIEDYINKSKMIQKHHSTSGKIGELFLTHPLIPRRIEALRLFAKSELYYSLTGKTIPSGTKLLSQDELNKRVENIIKLSEA